MRRLHWLLLLVLLVGWGSNYVAVSIAVVYSSPLVLATLRTAIGAIGMLPILLYVSRSPSKKPTIPRDLKTLGIVVIFSVLFSVIFVGFWFIAELTIDPDTASLVIYTNPLFVVLFAAVFLTEPITRSKALGTLSGFAGVFLILTKGYPWKVSVDSYGIVLLFLASVSCAASMIIYKKYLTGYDYYFLNFFQLVVSALLLFAWAAIADFQGFFAATMANWAFISALLYLSIVGTIISSVIWFILLEERGPTWYATWSFMVPVFAIVIGFITLGVTIVPVQVGGVAFIAAGLYLASK